MKFMNKIFTLYLIIFISTPIIIHAAPKEEQTNESQQIIAIIKTENQNLATLADNALFLVDQIQKNIRNESDRKKALKNIDITLKKLSTDTKNQLIHDISFIKKESNSFASHRKPLQKYNSLAAEDELKNLTATIKKIAENKSELFIIEAQQKLLIGINQTESIQKEALLAINKAQEQLRIGIIDSVEAAKIIGEQRYRINVAKHSLQKEIMQALEHVKQSDIQTDYLSQFSTAVYDLASCAIAPFKAGYWSTEKEKEIITGEIMSTNRKLFWNTVLAAGTLTPSKSKQSLMQEQQTNESKNVQELVTSLETTEEIEITKEAVQEFENDIQEEQEKLEKLEEEESPEISEVQPIAKPKQFEKEYLTEKTIDALSEQITTEAKEQQKLDEKAEGLDDERDIITAEIEALTEEVKDKEELLEYFTIKQEELEKQIADIEADISVKEEEKKQLDSQIEDAEEKSKILGEEQERVTDKIEDIEATIDAEKELSQESLEAPAL